MSREKSLIKNTAIITVGKICTQLISFLLLPLYTAVLTTQEYGTVDVFNTYIALVLPLATLMVEHGAFRYLVTHEDQKDIKQIVSSSLFVVVIMNIAFVLLSLILFKFYNNYYKYYLIPLLVSGSLQTWGLQIARGFKRLEIYSIGSFISALLTILLNVIFITLLGIGARGMLIANAIGNMVAVIYIFIALRLFSFISFSGFDKDVANEMLKYSTPLIPNTLSLWAINSSDRAVVNVFLGESSNGILAVSHKFPSFVFSCYSVFQIAWHEYGALHWNEPDGKQLIEHIMEVAFKMFSCISITCMAILPLIYRVMVPNPEYSKGYVTIPIYMAAVIFNIAIGLTGVVYVANKNTTEIAKTTIIAGIINIVVHIILIRKIGLYASALSTLIAYIIAFILRYKSIQKYIRLKIDYGFVIIITLVFAAVTIVYYYNGFGISIACFILTLILDGVLCKDVLLKRGSLDPWK